MQRSNDKSLFQWPITRRSFWLLSNVLEKMGFKLVTLLIVCSINLECIAGSCLCHVVPNFSCPPPPYCCESGMYTFDECGCCLECAKSELQPCGASAQIDGTGGGKCAKGLSCLKTCSKRWPLTIKAGFLPGKLLFFLNYLPLHALQYDISEMRELTWFHPHSLIICILFSDKFYLLESKIQTKWWDANCKKKDIYRILDQFCLF